ncbi:MULTISPECIES: FlgO family outer membrane protein [unclassified Pseudoalteromonas]|uniref:FlgO family outer membrane protein n=1 Tax=unclassified Pseudoalteromonas TaxID=194690 RepID=UPI003015638B
MMKFLIWFTVLFMVACSNTSTTSTSNNTVDANTLPNIESYGAQLAQSLGQHVRPYKPNSTVAVTSFFKADALQQVTTGQGAGLSVALQESLITHLTQMGADVVEYRLSESLSLQDAADNMLTRELANVVQRQKIDLVVVGTIVETQDAYLVNARLVGTLHNKAVSAAAVSIPKSVMWGTQNVTHRDGQLIRSQY